MVDIFFNALERVGGYCAGCKRGVCAAAQIDFLARQRTNATIHMAKKMEAIANHLKGESVAVMTIKNNNIEAGCKCKC